MPKRTDLTQKEGRCRSALDQSRPNSRSKDRVRMRTWTPLSRARRVLRARLVPCVLNSV